MRQITVSVARLLNADAEDVYTMIADYRQGHPRIVPPEHFSHLEVEKGGYGDGTVIRFTMTVLGTKQSFYQRVMEPEPGHVLVEQDIDSPRNITTTFTVTPVEQGVKSHVRITTIMNASPGIQGMIESIVVPFVNPRIYRKELKLLEQVAQQRK
ncbi:MAG: SRPBCC family protein [Ktedonobacteraceae bacterium]